MEVWIGFAGVIIGVVATVSSQHWLSKREHRHQLRMAALDKRLAAHQDAYALWQKLRMNLYKDTNIDVVIECQNWWHNHCLYLTPEAREAFQKAYISAIQHANYVNHRAETNVIEKNWNDIERAGAIIVNGVGLPELGEQELKVVQDKDVT